MGQTAATKTSKAADAFRTISEAATELDVPQHVLRHWEEVFGQIRPMRRAGGRRYYRALDLDILRGVRVLLYEQRFTTKGVQKIFKDNGAKYIAEIGRLAAAGEPLSLRPMVDDESEPTALLPPIEASNPYATEEASDLPSRLEGLLARLERAQTALDDAIAAVEAIDHA